jgi:hypothetical protein
MIGTGPKIKDAAKPTFYFDSIFRQDSSNYEVYSESCKSIVESFVQGYNGNK